MTLFNFCFIILNIPCDNLLKNVGAFSRNKIAFEILNFTD